MAVPHAGGTFYLRLARSFRLILFDKRGTGLSDHGGQFATLETRMELDLHAVLDAAGSEKAVILASHEGCGMAALFAATYPERARALALFHPTVRGLVDDDPDQAAAQLRDLAIDGAPRSSRTSSCATSARPCIPRTRSGGCSPTTCGWAPVPQSRMR